VRAQPLTIVLGASGTGKSSVVKAGLLPRLRGSSGESWEVLGLVRPGATPLAALSSLTLPGDANASLAERVRRWMEQRSDAMLMLVVDQFEELVTQGCSEEERASFQMQIAGALDAWPERLRVVLTLRSDFEPQFSQGPLRKRWLSAVQMVPPLSQDELREVIEGPASVRVLYFEPPRLVEKLINDVIQTPGALPLVSFTLSELYLKYVER